MLLDKLLLSAVLKVNLACMEIVLHLEYMFLFAESEEFAELPQVKKGTNNQLIK